MAQLQFVLNFLRPEGILMLDRAEALEAHLVADMDGTTDERRGTADGFTHVWEGRIPAFLGVPGRDEGDRCDSRSTERLRRREPKMFEDIKAQEMEEQAALAARRKDDEAVAHAMADDVLGGPPAPCEELRAMTPRVNKPKGPRGLGLRVRRCLQLQLSQLQARRIILKGQPLPCEWLPAKCQPEGNANRSPVISQLLRKRSLRGRGCRAKASDLVRSRRCKSPKRLKHNLKPQTLYPH